VPTVRQTPSDAIIIGAGRFSQSGPWQSGLISSIGTLRAGTSQSMDQPQGAIGLAAAREFLFNAFPATASSRCVRPG